MERYMKNKLFKLTLAAGLVYGSVQLASGGYHFVQEARLDDRPFLMTCESGALIWGQGGGFNVPEAERRKEAAMPKHAGGVPFPAGAVGETKGKIGEHVLPSHEFDVVYTRSGRKMDNKGDYAAIGLQGEGRTGHFYLDSKGELHPVAFSLVKNYVTTHSTANLLVGPQSKQVARIVGVMPPDAKYAVFHRTLSLSNGAAFDGWWAVPLTHEFRYQPTKGDYAPENAAVWGPSSMVYQEYGKKLVECGALVHQTKGIYDLFKVDETGEEPTLLPLDLTVSYFNTYAGEVFVGNTQASLATLPSNPRSLYDDHY